MQKLDFLTFKDGIVSIGDKEYRFGNRVTGYKRHYAARTAGVSISKQIHIPYTENVEMKALATIGERKYIVDQVQLLKDTKPSCTVLTLIDYKVRG